MDSATFHLFLRLLLGLVFLISGVGKFLHLSHFKLALRDYDALPRKLDAQLHLSRVLSYCIPAAEAVAGVSLITGIAGGLGVTLAIGLLVIFCGALVVNLRRGRSDLSCHCGEVLGEHLISWWMVGRNIVLILALVLILATPQDIFSIKLFSRHPAMPTATMWVNTALPVVILVAAILAALFLINTARSFWRSATS
jgi:uncharacterized membrane protein YphA (DoxX/SURF4 family)